MQPKKRVTLYLDATLVERFKQMAGERGYQTLNEALKNSLQQSDIGNDRKVIAKGGRSGRPHSFRRPVPNIAGSRAVSVREHQHDPNHNATDKELRNGCNQF